MNLRSEGFTVCLRVTVHGEKLRTLSSGVVRSDNTKKKKKKKKVKGGLGVEITDRALPGVHKVWGSIPNNTQTNKQKRKKLNSEFSVARDLLLYPNWALSQW
jgi:hypothetical protein